MSARNIAVAVCSGAAGEHVRSIVAARTPHGNIEHKPRDHRHVLRCSPQASLAPQLDVPAAAPLTVSCSDIERPPRGVHVSTAVSPGISHKQPALRSDVERSPRHHCRVFKLAYGAGVGGAGERGLADRGTQAVPLLALRVDGAWRRDHKGDGQVRVVRVHEADGHACTGGTGSCLIGVLADDGAARRCANASRWCARKSR